MLKENHILFSFTYLIFACQEVKVFGLIIVLY